MIRFIVLALLCSACGPITFVTTRDDAPPEVAELTIPLLDEWIDRYADGKKGDVRFFNLTKVMKKYDVNRLEAVEVQNTYRDLTRTVEGIDRTDALRQAIATVKSGTLESKVDRDALSKAKFIVVFDLDDTLYDQYYAGGEACNEFSFKRSNGKMKYIQPAPGWKEIIKTIHRLDGRVIIFSANLDDTTLANLAHMKIDGKPLTESPLISGIMTNSHLIQQEKTEPPGSIEKPRKGRPVIEPSKDLRFFDESLKNVIIVDDNPLRLFQFRNTRVFKKFHADDWCTTKDEVVKAGYDVALQTVSREIEAAVEFMNANQGVPFATAYLPYTPLGQTAVKFIMDGRKWTEAQAIDYLRRNPQIADARF